MIDQDYRVQVGQTDLSIPLSIYLSISVSINLFIHKHMYLYIPAYACILHIHYSIDNPLAIYNFLPMIYLEYDEVDEVDDGDDEGHEEQALAALHTEIQAH